MASFLGTLHIPASPFLAALSIHVCQLLLVQASTDESPLFLATLEFLRPPVYS